MVGWPIRETGWHCEASAIQINVVLTWKELEEVMLDVEVAINNRPLTYVEDDVQLPLLTTNLMIYGEHNLIPEMDADSLDDTVLRNRAKYLRRCKDVLWSRWTKEYVRSLRERHNLKHNTKELDLKIGDVVLIQSDERNRGKWNIGIVEKTHRRQRRRKRSTFLMKYYEGRYNGDKKEHLKQLCDLVCYITTRKWLNQTPHDQIPIDIERRDRIPPIADSPQETDESYLTRFVTNLLESDASPMMLMSILCEMAYKLRDIDETKRFEDNHNIKQKFLRHVLSLVPNLRPIMERFCIIESVRRVYVKFDRTIKTTGPNEIPRQEAEPMGIQNCQDFHGNHLYGIEIFYGVTSEAACDEGAIKCVQVDKDGSIVVTFASQTYVEKILDLGTLTINGFPVVVSSVDARRRYVKIYFLLYEVSNQQLQAALSEYGHVYHVRRDSIYDFKEIESGVRTVTMTVNKDVPSFLKVMGCEVKIFYRGQRQTCRKCGSEFHFAKDCPNTRCFRCHGLGHVSRECDMLERCERCGEEGHTSWSCKAAFKFAAPSPVVGSLQTTEAAQDMQQSQRSSPLGFVLALPSQVQRSVEVESDLSRFPDKPADGSRLTALG
ncbi:hypothetical protein QZH41_002284 [Actinostola sp. cb2023]|nr:hypothetical protein QZH41_002284 [Actinostola sp. cb2023]